MIVRGEAEAALSRPVAVKVGQSTNAIIVEAEAADRAAPAAGDSATSVADKSFIPNELLVPAPRRGMTPTVPGREYEASVDARRCLPDAHLHSGIIWRCSTRSCPARLAPVMGAVQSGSM